MNRFASGKIAKGTCDVCGQTFLLKTLKELTVKRKKTGSMACVECWSPDHPQLFVGERKVVDAQSLRKPRPDTSRLDSINMAWGWAPVVGASATAQIGQVTL